MKFENASPILGILICLILIALIHATMSSASREGERWTNLSDEVIRKNLKVVCLEGYEYLYSRARIGSSLRTFLVPRFDPMTDKPKRCFSPLSEEEGED